MLFSLQTWRHLSWYHESCSVSLILGVKGGRKRERERARESLQHFVMGEQEKGRVLHEETLIS